MVVSNYWIKKESFRFSHKETLWKNNSPEIYIFTAKMPINSLPAQVCELQDSHVRLCPGHFPPALSLLIILVLILMRVPPPQRAEQSPLSQLLHSQFIGVSWIEYNVHNVSYNINLFLMAIEQQYSIFLLIQILTDTISARLFAEIFDLLIL